MTVRGNMGIQDRDYYRDGSNSFLTLWGRQGAVVWLIIITCAVFFLQCLYGDPQESSLVKLGDVSVRTVAAGEVWRLITAVFLHASIWHLFVNMLFLYWAGSRLEEMLGSFETLVLYLMAGVFSSLVFVLAQLADLSDHYPAIGASGAVMALLVLYALHFPNDLVYLFFILRVPVWLLAVFFVVFDLFGAFNGGRGIAVFAHLGGALFGLLYYQTGWRFTNLLSLSSFFSRPRHIKPRLRVVVPESDADSDSPPRREAQSPPHHAQASNEADEHLEAKLDRILEKVSKQGQESLTAEERELLVKASELYKKRRK